MENNRYFPVTPEQYLPIGNTTPNLRHIVKLMTLHRLSDDSYVNNPF